MSTVDRESQVLDAAYRCFTRHGVRRTTMDDIAREAGISRPAVYRHVRSKEDAFRRLVERMVGGALEAAERAARSPGEPHERLVGVLATKLGLVAQVWHDGPAHAAELLAVDARLTGDLLHAYDRAMTDLIARVVADALPEADAEQLTAILLAITRGLEADLDTAGPLLRAAVDLLVAGTRADVPALSPPPTESP